MDVSVVIPSYKSSSTLALCIDSIMRQKTGLNYEVIIVDSSHDRSIADIIAMYPSVKFIELSKRVSAGIARNTGAGIAKGKILAFIDADVYLSPDWLEKCFYHYKRDRKIFVGSIDIWKNGVKFLDKLEWFFEFSEFKPTMPPSTRWCLPSYSLVVSKDIFDKIKFTGLEKSQDTEFTVRLAKEGHTLYFIPELIVFHMFRSKLSILIKKIQKFGFYTAYIRKEHLDWPPKYIYSWKSLALMAGPAFAFAKFIKISWRNLRYNELYDKLLFLFSLPLVIILICSWLIGFYKYTLSISNFGHLDEFTKSF